MIPATRRSMRESMPIPAQVNLLHDDMDWSQRKHESADDRLTRHINATEAWQKRSERRQNILLAVEGTVATGVVGNLLYFLLTRGV